MLRRETKLVQFGRTEAPGPANPPVVRASTILHDTVASYEATKARRETDDAVLSYGRRGTTTAHQLARSICELEEGEACFLFPSGVAAIAGVLSALLRPGDHLLVVDTIFPATRIYCEKYLKRNDISIDYFPWDATDLSNWVKPETKLVFVESPASQTYEVMDLPRLCESAHALGLHVVADNTYGSGWLYQPLKLGCDVSIIAGTKYLSGHADVMMGCATVKGEMIMPIRSHVHMTGQILAPDEAYSCLRGMRTLGLRLERHGENSQTIAHWLSERPEVVEVLHPSMEGMRGYEIWKRDASGSNGLLSVVFQSEFDTEAFMDQLNLFSIGSSWGGFESLAMPIQPKEGRELTTSDNVGPMIRFHIGLEHVDDLIEDMADTFSNMHHLKA
uniref:cystathionine beta-lyase n=1 Tax=Pararhizobium sp. IMCC3301 TaxID=3067904 RepID=UPI002740AF12|nr:cystathionine beta-lyase [Pararhizobium sp. IMCC3301]